jgi:hypothetical protein
MREVYTFEVTFGQHPANVVKIRSNDEQQGHRCRMLSVCSFPLRWIESTKDQSLL